EMDVREVRPHAVDVVARDFVAVDRVVGVEHQPDVRCTDLLHHADRIVAGIDQIAVGRGRLDDDANAACVGMTGDLPQCRTTPIPGLLPGRAEYLPSGHVENGVATQIRA